MAEQGEHGISWTGRTWNPIRGCRRKNTDCINCYAEVTAARFSGPGLPYEGLARMTPDGPRWTGKVMMVEDHLLDPLRWTKPQLVFVNSMSDLFYEDLPSQWIDEIVAVMTAAHQHTFQVLTKRPERMARYLADIRPDRLFRRAEVLLAGRPKRLRGSWAWPLPNVWWGASMGHNAAVNEFMPHLQDIRPHAAVVWASFEPLTEELTSLDGHLDHECGNPPHGLCPPPVLDWGVGGGESQANARPCPVYAARRLRDTLVRHGVPFHWKQWGEWLPTSQMSAAMLDEHVKLGNGSSAAASGMFTDVDGDNCEVRVGKKKAGRLLDGKLWDEYPRGFAR